MRHGFVSMAVAVMLATTGLAAGCADGGGGPSAESPTSTRSLDRSGDRTASAPPERTRTPEERDTGTRTPESRPSETTVTRTVEPAPTEAVTERETRTATATATKTETEPALPAGASSQAPDESGTSSLVWLWLLFAAVVAGLIAWLVYTTRKRSAKEGSWNAKVTETCAQGAALRDAIRAAMLLGPGPETDARWIDLQHRTDDLNQRLYLLRGTAPTEEESLRVDDTLAALQALRLTMTAARSAEGGPLGRNRSIQADLQTFDYALGALRVGASV
ncbi:hypothetical protein [Actinomadura fibrosa]|uniref:DUF4129 domain-containing protein n=1 Tax=Actinomadura fibrosa TaxID=111802 RepID=A0ABW2XXT2_9ACTN|nr:hypothetical protein [Actinomadura fibrosa]